jgi:electron transfer flavoprotein beta subunit
MPNYLVCVKAVPESPSVGLDRETGYLRRSESKAILDMGSRYAIELALNSKQSDETITVLALGPTGTDVVIRQALAMGADDAAVISLDGCQGFDTLATAKLLADIIKTTYSGCEVLLGERSTDAQNGILAPMLAECLESHLYQSVIGLDGESVKVLTGSREEVSYSRQTGSVYAVSLEAKKPRTPNAMGIMKASKKPLTMLNVETTPHSKTSIKRSYKPEKRGKAERLKGIDAANSLLALTV